MSITENVSKILKELPVSVNLVGAVKTRSSDEVCEALTAGLKYIGHNYVQEAEAMYIDLYGSLDEAKSGTHQNITWHCIGHLQTNKVKKAVKIFDLIETVDSVSIAKEISKRSAAIDKSMKIMIEVNSAREEQKNGVFPENVKELILQIKDLPNLEIVGLMTMGPWLDDVEQIRPYFKLTKELFDELSTLNDSNISMKYLSMGMSDSYKIAIEEGANLVRIGTKLFGARSYGKSF